ncbi:hypothetical protein MCAG_00796 [Micromonospora sp. ATCC 39149]|nr:hypothetical protein MCAG_00796 [Micromonospora sp. ATCC 39149]
MARPGRLGLGLAMRDRRDDPMKRLLRDHYAGRVMDLELGDSGSGTLAAGTLYGAETCRTCCELGLREFEAPSWSWPSS